MNECLTTKTKYLIELLVIHYVYLIEHNIYELQKEKSEYENEYILEAHDEMINYYNIKLNDVLEVKKIINKIPICD